MSKRIIRFCFSTVMIFFAYQKGFAFNRNLIPSTFVTNKFPHALLTSDYEILNQDDLEINSCIAKPRAFSEKSYSYPYWQCLPVSQIIFTCDNKNIDGTYSKSESLMYLEINNLKNKSIYVTRRAMEHKNCLWFKKRWTQLTSNESNVCLAGINAGIEKESDGSLIRTWVLDRFKTKKGCESYFEGHCSLDYLKKHGMCSHETANLNTN